MSTRQERYFKNYQYEEIPNNSKKGFKRVYKYVGDYYSWGISDEELKKCRIGLVALEIVGIALFFAAALINTSLNRRGFIVVPSCFAIVALLFELVAVGFFCFVEYPLKEEDYKRINSTFYLTFRIRLLCMLVASIASLLYTIQDHLGLTGIITAICYLLCGAIALFLHICYSKLNKGMHCEVWDSSKVKE